MIWQDAVIMLTQWIFVFALLPALRAPDKPPLMTSAITAVALCAMAAALASLDLWMSSAAAIGSAVCWIRLWHQRFRQGR